jgi:anaerobic ribonucleoside-triphosphate reductase
MKKSLDKRTKVWYSATMGELKVGQPCPCCGKTLVPSCDVPGCNGHVATYSRIVGYFRPIENWNEGKQEEYKDRKEFSVPASEEKKP